MLKFNEHSKHQTLPNNAPYSNIQGTFNASYASKVTHPMLTFKEHSMHQTLPK